MQIEISIILVAFALVSFQDSKVTNRGGKSCWPKYGPFGYHAGPARPNKSRAALAQPDNMIISLDRGLSTTTSEIINRVFYHSIVY